LADALRSKKHIHRPPFVFLHAASKNEILGCAIYAEPDGLVLSEMGSEISAAFFPYLNDKIGIPSRIFGPFAAAYPLAEIFANALHLVPEIHSRWRVHRLDELLDQDPLVSGQLILGTSDDHELVSSWGREYDVEKPANVNIEEFLLRKLEDGLLYLWVDGELKSLATLSGTLCAGPRVSAVFTPRALRGKGYAFALVYNLGKKYLESGSSYITLNTQLGEPVERMYGRLGYRVVGEKASIVFKKILN
jgi:hypothetical protein